MYCTRVTTNKQIKDFISFPDRLYINDNTRDKKLEKRVLKNKHTLSHRFKTIGVLVYSTTNVVGRCIATVYNDSNELYFGFFDVVQSQMITELLIKELEQIAKENNKSNIVGPIDCSFWIGYRLKTDNFGKPYTCEPYNREYYKELLENCGFNTVENYSSNKYRIPTESDINDKYVKRLDRMKDMGYKIVHPTYKSFDTQLIEIYELLSKLYSKFPYYTEISKEEFYEMFKTLKYILNYKMIYLVYKDNKLKGFMINVPNYGNLTCNLSIINILKVLKIKKYCKEYILLYMGVDTDALGVGSALAELTKRSLCKRGSKSIGALIHSGKISNNYYKDLICEKYEYILIGKSV